MRKLKNVFGLIVIALVVSVLGAACSCGKPEIVSATVKNGTIAKVVLINETVDTSNVVAVVKYKDNSTKEVPSTDLTFGTVDTSTTGNKTLNITYSGFTFGVSIRVAATEDDVNAIISMESQLIIDFKNNKDVKDNKTTEFYNRNQPLYAGASNPFDFRINATGEGPDGALVENLAKVSTIVTVQIKQGSYWSDPLTGTDLTNMVEIDPIDTTFDFKPLAVGETFKITVQAANRDTDYEEAQTKFSHDVVVVDAYNVYTPKELSVYDNANENGVWTDIKEGLGILDLEVNGIILQNDIFLTRDDVPTDYFWKTTDADYGTVNGKTDLTVAGSLKDSTNIFRRYLSNGDIFNFYGNYFSIDVSEFPRVIVQSGNEKVVHLAKSTNINSHATLFNTGVTDEDSSLITSNTKMNWSNIYFAGNANVSADPRNSGGIILMKNHTVDFEAYNTVMNNFFAGYFFELGHEEGTPDNPFVGNYLVDTCKGYDSFSILFYIWGAKNVLIKNSEFIGAGGPAIIADHCYHDDASGNGGYVSHVNIVNSKIESKVTGNEPWFDAFPGSSALVGQMSMLEAWFSGGKLFDGTPLPGMEDVPGTSKTIIAGTGVNNAQQSVPQLNIVGIIKSGDIEGLTVQRVKGYIRMFDTELDFNKYYALEDSEVTTYGLDFDAVNHISYAGGPAVGNFADFAMTSGQHYIQGSGLGGYIRADGGDASLPPAPYTPYADGNYLNLYIANGMGAILRMYNR